MRRILSSSIAALITLPFASPGASAEFVTLACNIEFDGNPKKLKFTIDMARQISEFDSETAKGEAFTVTNLETVIAPGQITITEPPNAGFTGSITHLISRSTLEYERRRFLVMDGFPPIEGTEEGLCEKVDSDKPENVF